jgi:hypothetical protein
LTQSKTKGNKHNVGEISGSVRVLVRVFLTGYHLVGGIGLKVRFSSFLFWFGLGWLCCFLVGGCRWMSRWFAICFWVLDGAFEVVAIVSVLKWNEENTSYPTTQQPNNQTKEEKQKRKQPLES